MARGVPPVLDTVAGLRERIARWRRAGKRIALVPTMGALHAGHLALVEAGLREAERVVVTIFVNPRQFAAGEDLAAYPRDLAGDLALLAKAGAHAVFAPGIEIMYPSGFATSITVSGVGLGLCGAMRPHFFGGVATVCAKLFLQVNADVAVFGEKDYQQLLVVRRLISDLDLALRIVAVPTVRAEDGLALSSRNAYLTAEQRRIAPCLFATLAEVAEAARRAEPVAPAIDRGIARLKASGFGRVDYLALCDAETLMPIARLDGPGRVLGAAWLGHTRLIDNLPA
jgi:pantoate--beta-alanine ligase